MTVARTHASLAAIAAIAAAVAAPLPARGEDPGPMQEGLWEISMQAEVPGMPFKMPATTVTHCYTKADLQAQGPVPKQDKDCKVTDVKRDGSSVSWKLACTGKNAGAGEGRITFSGSTAYEGSMKLTTGGMTMTTSYKGKRLGECK